jgi:Spy/CpxP family protein refolding chaperone
MTTADYWTTTAPTTAQRAQRILAASWTAHLNRVWEQQFQDSEMSDEVVNAAAATFTFDRAAAEAEAAVMAADETPVRRHRAKRWRKHARPT